MTHEVTSIAELEALYGPPSEAAVAKEVDFILPSYAAFIAASPFCLLATSGPEGLDCTPRGDGPGFVAIEDARTLLLPDRRGNNRVDSLRNIVRDPRVGLLFLIPGVGETLRVNGRATISTDPSLLARFEAQGKAPRTVLRITAEAVYFHCPKALIRSRLWDPAHHVAREALPSAGTILREITAGRLGGAEYDQAYPQRIRETLY